MAIDTSTIIEMLEAMRTEHRADHNAVLVRITHLDERIAALNANGCAQAWQHKAQGSEIRELKADVVSLRESRAEGRGRGAVVAIVVSAVVSVMVGVLVAFFKHEGA
jgi:hypothetical protein